ncbi:hypothetical protein EWP18_09420 [Neisseria meningitidis]|nr:hypothetical protein [Neisseria meningitidis]MBG8645063.1 hypothetical protein [Neisseria meningitidis]MBG8750655.1 hypothetical protein [Neisseria meningitidis]
MNDDFVFFHRISFSVETPPFGAAGSDFIWEGRNPFQIRTIHRAVLYVPSCVLKHRIPLTKGLPFQTIP